MTPSSSKEKAIAFLTAHFAGDVKTAAAFCAPSFESVIFAPVEIFPHLGRKTGSSWIEESIRRQERRYEKRVFDVQTALGEGDEAALIVRVNLTKRSDRRVIDFTSVHLFTFENGLVIRHREFFDSFDMVEKLLGVDLTEEFSERLRNAV